jgi:hypothetical protein
MITRRMAVLLKRIAWAQVRGLEGLVGSSAEEVVVCSGCMGVAGESIVPLRLLKRSR